MVFQSFFFEFFKTEKNIFPIENNWFPGIKFLNLKNAKNLQKKFQTNLCRRLACIRRPRPSDDATTCTTLWTSRNLPTSTTPSASQLTATGPSANDDASRASGPPLSATTATTDLSD